MSTNAGLSYAASPIYDVPSMHVGSGSGFGGTTGVNGGLGSLGKAGSKAPLHKIIFRLESFPLKAG
jgi:hypothetical protein